jgi:DNA repair photolyase
MEPIEQTYGSPRWSGEILDCSMPLTFDQYSRCSFDCLYCFSFFQRSLSKYNKINKDKRVYTQRMPTSVNPERVRKLFHQEKLDLFSGYVRERIAMQWGGLSDPFDMFEKQYGVGLEIMKMLHAMKYPICFSTKGTWWIDDPKYMDLFRNNPFWNVKMSIINLDADRARLMERGVPTPADRLAAMKRLVTLQGPKGGGVTLRLRPFIIGYTDIGGEYLELIARAAEAGATAVSTEFLCVESRCTPESKARFDQMSEIMGIDLLDFYRRNTVNATGYLRLNWMIKKPFVDKMEALCKKVGMRFYVSDAHHKDRCCNGSCCGLPESWNTHQGQFTSALLEAKRAGEVTWDWMLSNIGPFFDDIKVTHGSGLNIARGTPDDRARFRDWSITDYIRYIWNTPKHPRSPYRYFYGLMRPDRVDEKGNVVYRYQPYASDKTEET